MQPNPWPPTGGVPYTVVKTANGRAGESFVEIARKKQIKNSKGEVDPWVLIEFNFKTRKPYEVNNYLQDMFNAPLCPDGINRMFRGGEQIYLPPGSAPSPTPPPSGTPLDLEKLAEMLDVEPSELNRIFNQYNWTVDALLNVVGLVGEFAPIAVAAAEMISVGGLVLGTLTSFVGFFAYLARLDQLDGIAMGTFAGCYQVADWAVTPTMKLSEGSIPIPVFPDVWVKNDFLHTPPGKQLPDYYQDRYNGMKAAWEAGATQMAANLKGMIRKAYDGYSAKMAAKGVKPGPMQVFEDLQKLIL